MRFLVLLYFGGYAKQPPNPAIKLWMIILSLFEKASNVIQLRTDEQIVRI